MSNLNLDRIYETFMKIPDDTFSSGKFINFLRSYVPPLITTLKDSGFIDWYFFLIHDRQSGVPAAEDDNSAYVHFRLELRDGIDAEEFIKALPRGCVMTRKADREKLNQIAGIDYSMLKDSNIEEAWLLMGDISAWIVNMFDAHTEDINHQQIEQFLHFFANALQSQID